MISLVPSAASIANAEDKNYSHKKGGCEPSFYLHAANHCACSENRGNGCCYCCNQFEYHLCFHIFLFFVIYNLVENSCGFARGQPSPPSSEVPVDAGLTIALICFWASRVQRKVASPFSSLRLNSPVACASRRTELTAG